MTDFLVEYREAGCFLAGIVFAIVVAIVAKFFVNSVWPVVMGNAFAKWTIFTSQIGLEVFLLQQWIYGYNWPDSPSFVTPLIITVPLFFANIFMAIGVIAWMDKTKG